MRFAPGAQLDPGEVVFVAAARGGSGSGNGAEVAVAFATGVVEQVQWWPVMAVIAVIAVAATMGWFDAVA